MNTAEAAGAAPPGARTGAELEHVLDRLLSLHDGDLGVLDAIAFGSGAIPALRRRLLFRSEPSGVYQPRCHVVEALAGLGAYDVLADFLASPHEIADPVAAAGEEAVLNAAARAFAGHADARVLPVLLALAERRRLAGPIEVLGVWRRPEALPCMVAAREDDLARPAADMGDILGGGLILTLGSFMITLAGLDTGSVYGGIWSSRSVMVSILAEPTLILVFVGITLMAKAMLPFVVNHLLVQHFSVYLGPTHLFLVAAFFVLPLAETDRLPIHSSTPIEIYMIEEARILEYSGPLLALLRWASMMKQFILYTIFCNVLVLPWGLSVQGSFIGTVAATVALMAKFVAVACVVVFVDTTQSRLRFFRYQEPLAASFLLAVLAIVGTQLG